MGAVTSICCGNEKKTETDPLPVRKPKTEQRPLLDQKKEKAPQVKSNGVIGVGVGVENNGVGVGVGKESSHQEILREIQEKYPLPIDKKAIKWQSFQITYRIGSGGFGEVFLGQLIQNKLRGLQQKYAIKRIPKAQIFKRKLTSSIKLQKRILYQSKCNFITTLHYAFRDSKYLYLVMQWAQGGDTYSLINQKSARLQDFKKAGEPAVRFILGCLVLGMEYLHSKKIMYRDLKPQNILIFQNGYAKLTDFGLAKEVAEDQLSKTEAGTNIYYAPEMVLREGYGKQIDLWTIGVFSYQMSNYSPPFAGPEIRDKQRVKRLVKSAQTNRTWKNPHLSEQLKDFINSLLKFDPKQRLGYKSWSDIKNHKFFTCVNFDWQSLQEMKMKSPLKSIIDAHKLKYKVYIPQSKDDPKAVGEGKNSDQENLDGWTCKINSQT